MAQLLPPALAAQLDMLDLHSRKVLAGKLQGERRSKRRGRSVEFEDYREYVPGDDLRHVDWNVLARLDRMFVKVFQEEEDLCLELLVDASASMLAADVQSPAAGADSPSKLMFAARLAAALGYIGLVNNNRVGLCCFGNSAGLKRLSPVRGQRNTQRLVSFLLEHAFAPPLSPGAQQQSDFNASLRRIAAGQTTGGRGVIVLVSDLMVPPPPQGYAQGLRALAATGGGRAGVDVYVVQVLTGAELNPGVARESGKPSGSVGTLPVEPSNSRSPLIGDIRLTDAESGRAAEVTVTRELLAQYTRTMDAYLAGVRSFCAARAINHTLATAGSDIGELVLTSLRRQGMLR